MRRSQVVEIFCLKGTIGYLSGLRVFVDVIKITLDKLTEHTRVDPNASLFRRQTACLSAHVVPIFVAFFLDVSFEVQDSSNRGSNPNVRNLSKLQMYRMVGFLKKA